jgi:hypothetical protein
MLSLDYTIIAATLATAARWVWEERRRRLYAVRIRRIRERLLN